MKFRYSKVPLSEKSGFFGGSILKPIIPISIKIKNNTIRYAALVDSGADFCIFDGEIGEYLGLDVRTGQKETFGGIQPSSPSEAFLHDISINIGGWDYTTTVGFSHDISQHGYGILGQKGFFDIFVVNFDLAKEEIELKERKG